MSTAPVPCWLLVPSTDTGPVAGPMFPRDHLLRPEFRGVGGRPNPATDDDDNNDGRDGAVVALERGAAQGFFHRMGLALRVRFGEGARAGVFSNGVIDPLAIEEALCTEQAFSLPIPAVEAPLVPFARWLKPDARRNPARHGDMILANLLLSVLRDARHAGGQRLLFVPAKTSPTHVDNG